MSPLLVVYLNCLHLKNLHFLTFAKRRVISFSLQSSLVYWASLTPHKHEETMVWLYSRNVLLFLCSVLLLQVTFIKQTHLRTSRKSWLGFSSRMRRWKPPCCFHFFFLGRKNITTSTHFAIKIFSIYHIRYRYTVGFSQQLEEDLYVTWVAEYTEHI